MIYSELETLILDDYRLHRRRSLRTLETARLPHLRIAFKSLNVREITSARLSKYATSRFNHGAANASINRELAALRRMFTLASLPFPRFEHLREAPPRPGFVTAPEFARLSAALPDYLRDPIEFLYLSSWRLDEMRHLTWSEVHLELPYATLSALPSELRLSGSRTKNGRGRILPLRGALYDLILRALARRSPFSELVFHHHHGRALADFRRAWKSATIAAALPGLLIHDLRRSAVRNFIRAGVRESVAMALSGHRTRAVFDRYNITDSADLVSAIEAVSIASQFTRTE